MHVNIVNTQFRSMHMGCSGVPKRSTPGWNAVTVDMIVFIAILLDRSTIFTNFSAPLGDR